MVTRSALAQMRRPGARTAQCKPRDAEPRTVLRPVSASARRKYLAAVQSFTRYLRMMGTLEYNPVSGIVAPPPAPPRLVVVELPDVLRIARGLRTLWCPVRAPVRLRAEISAALGITRRDVDVERREVRAQGTKTHSRDRIVRVADWAWPHFVGVLAGKLPSARLFPGLDRWRACDEHRAHLSALGMEHHRLHDARHFYAVRAVKAGTPYELVARQLGHADVQMVAKVYGRSAPGHHDRARWEREASRREGRNR